MHILTDYHTHSHFSRDAADPPHKMCESAIEQGLSALAITDHAEWARDQSGHWKPEQYSKAMAECKEQFAGKLTVHTGVELGNPHWFPEQTAALLNQYDMAMKVCSVHWIEAGNIHNPNIFKGRSMTDVLSDYFGEMRRMVTTFDGNIVAHFDRIFWRPSIARFSGFDALETAVAAEPIIRLALRTIAQSNYALEFNTKVLHARFNWNEAVQMMLGWYREEGGVRLVVNSDAHHARDVHANAEVALGIVKAAGFESLYQFEPVEPATSE